MEMKFTEIDNLDNKSYELNQQKYWESTEKKGNIQKKKRVSFDDILSNMNLVVNQNGVLQSMVPLQNYEEPQYQQQPYQQQPYQYQQQPYQYQQQPYQQQQHIQEPLNPSVKHSYIFNKYFKDYKDANNNFKPQPKVPKTIEEYKQMVLEEKIKQFQERKRIAQIKSTKLLFTGNPNTRQNINKKVIRASKNNLRSMNFG